MIRSFLETCAKLGITIEHHVPLAPLCSFRTGGKAEMFTAPTTHTHMPQLLSLVAAHDIALTILGGGSNVLPPDEELKGLVISTEHFCTFTPHEDHVEIGSGFSVRKVSSLLANRGRRGLDFLYGMPGSMGGALWMNARCYGKEISEVLMSASGYALDGSQWHYDYDPKDFSYKQSPFQDNEVCITSCHIRTHADSPSLIWQDMIAHEMDRKNKGHYLAPCAGSVFKNNHEFGAPTGKLLDELHWRTQTEHDAMVNPYHANIIINTGSARTEDIYNLSLRMQKSIQESYNILLEHEIIFLGNKVLGNKERDRNH